MKMDPVLDELRETREKLLVQAGGTLDGLVDFLQNCERQSGREFVPPEPRARGNTSAEPAVVRSEINRAQ
jgi:hypothetical protein